MTFQVRDPVHGFIGLPRAVARLVETRPLQRLRGIRQLAMASLVYPGALHTRFDHTLGVAHVAGLMARSLGMHDDAELVECAALLHDIGHGPFSHVSEYALERYADRTKLHAEQKKEKIHELVTAKVIQTDSELLDILGRVRCDEVIQLLGPGQGRPALRSIVSGPLDADKQDYLLRDSYFCGVQYGVFDIHQMHRSLCLEGARDEEELMIDPDGIHTIEQFVLAKYYLTRNVYRHKVRLISDQMIVRAIMLGVEVDQYPELVELYAFDDSEAFVKKYLTWDDARFMQAFAAPHLPKCGSLLQRLIERRLLKRVFTRKVRDFREDVRELVMALGKKENDAVRAAIEMEVASLLSSQFKMEIDPAFVIAHSFSVRSVRESSRNDEAGILVATSPPRTFESESTLFASINEAYIDQYVQMYAPVAWPTAAEKNKHCRHAKEGIQEAIESACLKSLAGVKP